MALKRIMPCLLIKEKRLVKTVNFMNPKYVGDPINAVKIYNAKEVDELVVLDINASKDNSKIDYDLIKDFASECFMPLSYGGGVKKLDDFKKLYKIGVEKIIVNTILFDSPDIVKKAAEKYGNQSIVASIDVIKNNTNNYKIFSHSGRNAGSSLDDFISFVLDLNVGELLITSVNKDGTWEGYDTNLIKYINSIVDIPIIANGGCGSINDINEVLYESNAQAAAIGSMAVYQKKGKGVLIRFPNRNQIIKDED